MRHDFIDKYSRRDSPIHRLSANTKVISALLLVVVVVLSKIQWIYPFVAVFLLLLYGILTSKIPVGFILKRILLFEPFVIIIASMTLMQHDGMEKFISIIVKSTLSLLTIIHLSNTTPFADLVQFLRVIHTPPVFVTIVALMYRYIFILFDEMGRITMARRSRTFQTKTSRSWYVLSTVLGQLFLRSIERAERIYSAMCARGWR